MRAQFAANGRPAVAGASDTSTATSARASIAPNTPSISQRPYDRWTDLPDDVSVQVMYWLMRDTGSVQLALTSKRFLQAGQAFRAGPWYQDARAVLVHARAVAWTRTYLGGLAQISRTVRTSDISELNNALRLLSTTGDVLRMSLVVDGKPPHAAPGIDWLDGFRRYEGTSLRLSTSRDKQGDHMILRIAGALPPDVCLSLDVYINSGGILASLKGMAELFSRIARSGRTTAFEMQWGVDLSVNPVELGAVLDIACGSGHVSRFCFGDLHDPDIMLQALTDRCSSFCHLKLVMFDCSVLPSREQLVALAAALEKRQADGQSRVTVVVGCDKFFTSGGSVDALVTADERTDFEEAGLYLEFLSDEQPDQPAVHKVMRSVGKGPVDALLPRPNESADEASSDSDVLVASSDGDDDPDSSASGGDIEFDEPAVVPRRATRDVRLSDLTEPRGRKRNHCVIS